MPYEVTPGATPSTATEFPVPNVRVMNFTGTGFTCSRGAGEQSNVITILITPPAPPSSCLFLDQFLGAAGPITGHTPDTAPTGFAYANANVGAETTLALDGAGKLVGVQVGYPTSAIADSSASSPPFTIVATNPYTINVALSASPTFDDTGSATIVTLQDTVGGLYVEIGITRTIGGVFTAYADFNGAADEYALWERPSSAGDHTISVYVNGPTITVTYDGGAPEPADSNGGDAITGAYNDIRYLVDIDSPSDTSNLSAVSICNGPALP